MSNYKNISDELVTHFISDLDKWIVKPEFTSCWIWFGQRDKHGYGVLNTADGHFFAHRLMYRRFKGLIGECQIVRHTCDNPTCCNPDHLILGTQTDNMLDAKSRGRNARGERVHGAKLTADAVREIRSKFVNKRGIYSKLGREYKVDPETIRYIVQRKRWAHVN